MWLVPYELVMLCFCRNLVAAHSSRRTPEESEEGSDAGFIQVTVTSALQDCLHVPAPSISRSPRAALCQEREAVPFIVVLHECLPRQPLGTPGVGRLWGIVCPAALTQHVHVGLANAWAPGSPVSSHLSTSLLNHH